MKLDDFIRLADRRSLDAFCASSPHPALVFDGARGAHDSCFDTVLGTVAAIAAADVEVEIELLAKTDRNPFTGMITVGRSSNNDLCVEHPSVSKVHVTFLRDGDGWSILDPGSTNGTRVDGVRLEKNKPMPLHEGARVELGGAITARFYTARGLFEHLPTARVPNEVA